MTQLHLSPSSKTEIPGFSYAEASVVFLYARFLVHITVTSFLDLATPVHSSGPSSSYLLLQKAFPETLG